MTELNSGIKGVVDALPNADLTETTEASEPKVQEGFIYTEISKRNLALPINPTYEMFCEALDLLKSEGMPDSVILYRLAGFDDEVSRRAGSFIDTLVTMTLIHSLCLKDEDPALLKGILYDYVKDLMVIKKVTGASPPVMGVLVPYSYELLRELLPKALSVPSELLLRNVNDADSNTVYAKQRQDRRDRYSDTPPGDPRGYLDRPHEREIPHPEPLVARDQSGSRWSERRQEPAAAKSRR